MSRRDDIKFCASRRRFLTLVAAATGLGADTVTASFAQTKAPGERESLGKNQIEPFWGKYQGGIVTPMQKHTYFATFDLVTSKRDDVVALLRAWTAASARMTSGQPAQPLEGTLEAVAVSDDADALSRSDKSYDLPEPSVLAADTGEAVGLRPARLTLTFGFGAGLFTKDGKDRYGLASKRPQALVDMPKFVGDQLVEGQTGGDLSMQACADDPQVAFHAVRQLARLASHVAHIRWTQTGFIPNSNAGETPRNLMGFKDGTNNPPVSNPEAMAAVVWVGDEGPKWMRNGSYVVARRIRIALEHWDRMRVAFQEQTVGRHKYSGAPLGKKNEFDPLDLDAADKDGNPVIPENSHVRLASAANNEGAQIFRRPYSYNEGVNFTAERWPPWRQGLEYDAGLFFVCYQRDPRTGFIKIFEKMSKLDMMNQFVTHVGGGLFACPGGVPKGGYVGQSLLEDV